MLCFLIFRIPRSAFRICRCLILSDACPNLDSTPSRLKCLTYGRIRARLTIFENILVFVADCGRIGAVCGRMEVRMDYERFTKGVVSGHIVA